MPQKLIEATSPKAMPTVFTHKLFQRTILVITMEQQEMLINFTVIAK